MVETLASHAKNKTVRLIAGPAYVVCKHCGWSTGLRSHTTGIHAVSMNSGCSISFIFQTKLNKFVAGNGEEDAPPSKKKSTSTNILTPIMEQCARMEQDNGDPDQANFVGIVGDFMQKVMK